MKHPNLEPRGFFEILGMKPALHRLCRHSDRCSSVMVFFRPSAFVDGPGEDALVLLEALDKRCPGSKN